ncbi:hypothetical protein [Mucilaginibacter flavidus]|uniref:hypothetical protein n=1 Tax=Mucilaginibacter flavidus TaxID=2949309 RepID=UPI002092984B|nr:hypothetical protein [Mucilaginibacter flavidus]MCO5949936.1 hypothetical protein [Mucilaginibacter flavidus]
MSLFNFFKRSKKVKFDINNSSLNELLGYGILFEDNNKFLEWGTPVKESSKDLEVNEKLFADRSVYNWGEHTILKGLTFPLATTYWKHREDSVYKIFNSIVFSVTGNEEAKESLELIKIHLVEIFGEPQSKEITDTEIILEWIVNNTRLCIHYFEQYTNKLTFEINRL